MKQLYLALLLLLSTIATRAQDDIFVLVDVSKSVKQSELNDAKQALTEVLNGTQLSKAFVAQGKQQDLTKFKLGKGDKLALSRFGGLNTTLAITPSPLTVNTSGDIDQAVNSVAWVPVDDQTYITLAKAKIAEYAKRQGIGRYILCIISDNVNDDYGPNGKPGYPDDYTRELAEGYNTSTNPVGEAGYTKLKFSKNSLFTLSFSPSVDVSKYSLPGGTPPPVQQDPGNPAITITSPAKAKKGSEYELKTETLNVTWACNNCAEGVRYTVNIAGYDGSKFRDVKKDITSNRYSVKLPAGKFRVTVSASNYPEASSDTTYVVLSTGGGYGWLLFILALLIIGGIAYYLWNKRRTKKIEGAAENKPDDIFNKPPSGGGGATNNPSNNDIYF